MPHPLSPGGVTYLIEHVELEGQTHMVVRVASVKLIPLPQETFLQGEKNGQLSGRVGGSMATGGLHVLATCGDGV